MMPEMLADNLRIRKAGAADVGAIVAANQEMALETEHRRLATVVIQAGVEGLLQRPQYGFYLVAEVHQTVVGTLMITYEWSDWRNGVFWWIQSVYVWPEWRRRGVYRELYQAVRRLAAAEPKVCGFRLYVEKDNERAQQTYRALGMTETDYRLYEAIDGIKPDRSRR